MMKFSSQPALQIVEMTISSAANEENFFTLTAFSLQCMICNLTRFVIVGYRPKFQHFFYPFRTLKQSCDCPCTNHESNKEVHLQMSHRSLETNHDICTCTGTIYRIMKPHQNKEHSTHQHILWDILCVCSKSFLHMTICLPLILYDRNEPI